jgi:hypothetical protein
VLAHRNPDVAKHNQAEQNDNDLACPCDVPSAGIVASFVVPHDNLLALRAPITVRIVDRRGHEVLKKLLNTDKSSPVPEALMDLKGGQP